MIGLGFCLSVTTFAQVRYRPTENGPWRPWSFTATTSARQSRGATTAEVQAFQARLQELAAIVKRAPVATQPVGFAAELWGSLNGFDAVAGPAVGRTVPLAGSLTFGAFPLIEFERGGRTVNEDLKGGETELLQFVVNQLDASVYGTSRPPEWGGAPVDAFVEPPSSDAVAGLPRVGDVFVVRKNGKSLWVPLSLADALQPIAGERRTIFESRRTVYSKQVAEFEEWKTPAKRAARRAEWQKAAASMPNGAEFLANMEKADGQIETGKTSQLAPGGPDDKSVQAAERDVQEVKTILTGLTPEAKSGPSCYDARASRLADRFRALEGAPAACRALVRPNPGYFDSKLPRSSPQVVMLAAFTRCLRPEAVAATTPRGGCVINRELVQSMDWDAVRSWLDR